MRLYTAFAVTVVIMAIICIVGQMGLLNKTESTPWEYRQAQLAAVGLKEWRGDYLVVELPRLIPEVGLYRVVVGNIGANGRQAISGWLLPSQNPELVKIGDPLGLWQEATVVSETFDTVTAGS
jgi:hypothetical protein